MVVAVVVDSVLVLEVVSEVVVDVEPVVVVGATVVLVGVVVASDDDSAHAKMKSK